MARRRPSPVAGRRPVDAGEAELLEVRPGQWLLTVQGVPQSHVDLRDPRHLELPYVRTLGDVADLAGPVGEPLATVHLGAGLGTLARYVAATRPGSVQVAVDVDAALVALVRDALGTDGFRLRVGDAADAFAHLRPGGADLVVLDAFLGDRAPAHLTGRGHASAVARVLSPTGTYAANVGDAGGLAYARAHLAALAEALPHVALVADAAVLRGRRFGNLVLVASAVPLPASRLGARAAARGASPPRVLSGQRARDWAGRPPASPVAPPVPPPGAFRLHR